MRIPDWRLPIGVDRALWEYMQRESIAGEYDRFLSSTDFPEFDARWLEERFERAGRLIDLGCGTGRIAERFAARGFSVVAVDLSERMLEEANRRRRRAAKSFHLAKANLCDLSAFRDSQFDYAAAMFSTLGMIVGEAPRRAALGEIRRILRPRGRLALHLHNRWGLAFHAAGRRRLVAESIGRRPVLSYRGVPNLSVGLFDLRRIRRELGAVDLRIIERTPILSDGKRTRALPTGLVGDLRCDGWLILAETGACRTIG